MDFLAQIDLTEVHAAGGPDWLPDRGEVLVFYDTKNPGPTPEYWRVILQEGPGSAPASPPPGFRRRQVRFEAAMSYALHSRNDDLTEGLSTAEQAALEAALGVVPRSPAHQIGGYAEPIQGDDMEEECHLASGGPDGSSPDDWRLLLQLDSDAEMRLEWGDGGTLYVWVREEAARRGDFSDAWAIWQCY